MPDPSAPRRRVHDAVVLAGGLALLVVLGVTSLRTKSAVYDEIVHFSAGYTSLRFGEFRFNADHPPLVARAAARSRTITRPRSSSRSPSFQR